MRRAVYKSHNFVDVVYESPLIASILSVDLYLPAEINVCLHADVVDGHAVVLERLGQIVHADALLPEQSFIRS